MITGNGGSPLLVGAMMFAVVSELSACRQAIPLRIVLAIVLFTGPKGGFP
jgi:hypothetical protein